MTLHNTSLQKLCHPIFYKYLLNFGLGSHLSFRVLSISQDLGPLNVSFHCRTKGAWLATTETTHRGHSHEVIDSRLAPLPPHFALVTVRSQSVAVAAVESSHTVWGEAALSL